MKAVRVNINLDFDIFNDEEVSEEIVKGYIELLNTTLSSVHPDSSPKLVLTDEKFKVINPNILTYDIETGMGKTSDRDKLSFLTDDEFDEFNKIGYSGKDNNNIPTSRVSYLNSLDKGIFEVRKTKFDNGDFIERFQIIRVL